MMEDGGVMLSLANQRCVRQV